jgi:hypothetical protein
VTQPVYLETWANPPEIPATVPAGAAAGDPGPWIMAGGYASLGTADPTASPPAVFRVYDRHAPGEAIQVVDTRADPLWSVVRGDQGTPVLDHDPGFEVTPLISAAGLDGRAPGVPSGNGLMLPGVTSYFAPAFFPSDSVWRSCWPTPRRIENPPGTFTWMPGGGLLVPDGEAVPGSVYECVAWGQYTTGSAGLNSNLWFQINWSDATVTDHVAVPSLAEAPVALTNAVPDTGQTSHARWRAHGLLAITAVNLAYVNLSVYLSPTNAAGDGGGAQPPRRFMIAGTGAGVPQPIITSGPRMFAVLIQKTAGTGTVATAGNVTVLGGKTWRAA